jgi:hypothetical protein
MGYTTDFEGSVKVEPPLNESELDFLIKFNESRRMECEQGPYFVDRSGSHGQGHEGVIDYNSPPKGQPGLWCQWVPTSDGTAIQWDGGEKFYSSVEWMRYLIEHFLGSTPIAADQLPFLQGHVLNGEIEAQGEEPEDRWKLIVRNNVVTKEKLPQNKWYDDDG